MRDPMVAAPLRSGMHGSVDRRYRSDPMRYVRAALYGSLAPAVLVAFGGVVVLALYEDLTGGQFLRLVLASELVYAVESALTARAIQRSLAPVERWLAGCATAREAWSAAAGLPLGLLRRPGPYVTVALGALAFDLYVARQLGLPGTSVLVLLPGSALVYLYWLVLRFLLTEHALRPLLEDVAAHLPARLDMDVPRLALRWRLVATLPAISVIGGAIVAGVGDAPAGDLGAGILAAVVVTGTVSGVLTYLLSHAIAGPVAELRAAAQRIGNGDLTVRVPVSTTDEIGDLALAFNDMAEGLRERERLQQAFGTFVDPSLAQRVARNGVDLGGDVVELSAMFLDVRGFTTFAESADPRDVVGRLNVLFELVVPIVLRHGGTVNKFVGDGLLAIFGAPEPAADHADRAVAAGREVAEATSRGAADELRIGIGIHSGRAVVGTVGGGGRLDFTVIGDTVNTAARVESATRQTGDDLLISDATLVLLRTAREAWVERPAVALKGKRRPVALYGQDVDVGATAG